jgi:hypothetical protein
MKLVSLLSTSINEAEDKYTKGLHQAKVGDAIWIGKSGTSVKDRSVIKKILSNGNLVDADGNIFSKNGQLVKGGNDKYLKKNNPDKKISAQIITQKDYDDEYKKIKVDHLRNFDWNKLTVDELNDIIDKLPIKQANRLSTSRFK